MVFTGLILARSWYFAEIGSGRVHESPVFHGLSPQQHSKAHAVAIGKS
jgi:hypothetical protein